MGILPENLNWFLKYATRGSVLELGNQFLYIARKPFAEYPDKYLNPSMCAPVAAKPYFVELGFDHTSVDLSGKDGALTYDLGSPFDLGRKFDYITDFGTSEHVVSLYHCLKNLHAHSRPGTRIFHVNPLSGHWPKHGYHYRHREFYLAYAAATGYGLLDILEAPSCDNYKDGWNIWCLLENPSNRPFISEEEFSSLPIAKE